MGIGVASLTPAASEVVSIAGVQTSFAQAAEVTLQKLCGLRLSEWTVERVTEAAGERLAELRKKRVTFGPRRLGSGNAMHGAAAAPLSAWTPQACGNKQKMAPKPKAAWPMWG